MWTFLTIIGVLILIITLILLLPINLIIKFDKENKFIIRYKILGKTFGNNPNPKPKSNSKFAEKIKKASGISRLEKENLKDKAQKTSLSDTVSDSFSLVTSLLKRAVRLLKKCTLKTLKLNIVCAESDAAKTAISYGRCYAIVSPFITFLHSIMKVRKKGEDLNITCDYETKKNIFEFEIVISVRVFRILAAVIGIAYDETKRSEEKENL